MKEEPPSPEFPNGRVWVEVAVSVYDHGKTGVYINSMSPQRDRTVDTCLEWLKAPMTSAIGVLSGWIPKLSEREMWELKTPACDKKHKKNPHE